MKSIGENSALAKFKKFITPCEVLHVKNKDRKNKPLGRLPTYIGK